ESIALEPVRSAEANGSRLCTVCDPFVCPASNTENFSHSPTTTTRSNRGFELSPRVRSSENRDPKPAPTIASLTPQPELQIEYQGIRRPAVPPSVVIFIYAWGRL